ncbi:unnamed protein product [Acanthoscelides obtectus]|uniref:Uncharacterized protein n=1 Tax=Acanthoscelides obtectus TaxID=200917 RepID=A0A9P0VSC6_ACAOB|nr:unnamed protein product [Acanthoscelides obtectus]CAK1688600.1 hypothetical protein AOBTE_LOCUS36765 [Acanthoscelides obtectus]
MSNLILEYVQEDDGGSTTSNNQADDVPKIPSSRSSTDAGQYHPTAYSFLMPWESSTYILQNSVTIEEFPSNEILTINSPAVVELNGGDTYEKTVLQNTDI